MPTKLQRFLDLIAFLVARRLPVSADELMRGIPAYAERWQSDEPRDQQTARRTFERDKDELRALGIPIRTVKYHLNYGVEEAEGYAIDRRDFYLPYLKLVQQATPARERYADRHRVANVEISESDAPLALEALRRVADIPAFPLAREARSAFRKLAFDLDPQAFLREPQVLYLDNPGAAELTSHLRVLSDALLARKRVSFRYHGIHRGEETSREVEPYGLLLQHGHWYLIGRDLTRAALRVFRVGRMDDLTPNTSAAATPDYAIPTDFRLDSYADREAWELGGEEEQPVVVQVLFGFPLSLWAARNERGTLVEQRDDGAAVRSFDVHQVQPFLRWVLSQEGEAEIIAPAELARELRALAEAVAAAHRGGRDAG